MTNFGTDILLGVFFNLIFFDITLSCLLFDIGGF